MADTSGADQSPLRVILVGRSPIESTLRRDPGIELLRARTPTDCLGEIGQIESDGGPTRTAVLVAPESIATDERAAFYEAARAIHPELRFLSVADDRAPEDGALAPDTDGPRLRAELERLDLEAAAPPAPAPGAAASTSDESAMLEALLAGQDPTLVALEQIRRAAGAPVEFVPSAVARGAPVRRKDRIFGTLVARAVEPAVLARLADRFALWLAVAEQHRQLRHAAFTDPLTSAWNRRYFDRFFASAIDRARAARRDLTVLVFDIDDFKTYNDRFSHAAGDEILTETVRLLRSVVRPTDLVCRIGGDEFAVIFNEPEGPRKAGSRHPASIADLAKRFQRQIVEHRFPKLSKGAPCTLTISGGLATFPWDGATAEDLLERADQLAMESKRQGKNVITFGPGAERCCRGPARPDVSDPPASDC